MNRSCTAGIVKAQLRQRPQGSNIVLIGMPGSGKSTLGRRLAKLWGLGFVDTDDLIEQHHGVKIQQLLEQNSLQEFRDLEQQVLCSVDLRDHVVATGGSAVYSEAGMLHLSKQGQVIYLRISSSTLNRRVKNSAVRGLVKQPGQSLQSLLEERRPLYEYWSDLSISNDRSLNKLRLDALAKTILGQ